MKNTTTLLFLFLSFSTIKAQQISDALQYSQDDITGNARYRAMGGAFGALGGNLSALNVNPAGSAIFTSNFSSVTLSSYNQQNESNYFGTKSKEDNASLDMNQLGMVWVFDNYYLDSKWSKFSIAMNYDQTNNFNNSMYARGYNPTNSVANYYLSYANGIPENILSSIPYTDLSYNEQQAYLGYNGYFINPTTGNQYTSAVNPNGNYFQENNVESRGYNGKITFNIGAEYDKRFYFGMNLNAHFSNFETTSSFYEDTFDSPGNNTATGVQASRFTNQLYTYGSGFSFQLGAIAKVTNDFRVGLSYESPTWYNLNDELKQTLSVNCPDCIPNTTSFIVSPNTVLIYPTYQLKTTARYTGSLSYIFGSKGLISFDYSLRDYSNLKFQPSSEFFSANDAISNALSISNEVRIGGEYRIKRWSVRGGFRYEESPYKNKNTVGNLNSYSTGFGYDFGDFKIDMAYIYAKRTNNTAFFAQGLTDTANVKAIQNNVVVTVGFQM